MKYRNRNIYRRKNGFTIIESVAYIFLTTIILSFGINLFISMYKSYLEITKLSIQYNNYQNFFINLDNIISEGGVDEISVNNNQIIFSKNYKFYYMNKTIKFYDGKILIKYVEDGVTKTINTMLENVDNLEIKKKEKLIYFIIYDKDGRKFVKCI